MFVERRLLQRRREEEAHQTIPREEVARRLSLGDALVGGDDRPAAFRAQGWNPFLILKIMPTELLAKGNDFVAILFKDGVEHDSEPWWEVIVDHHLHATASPPICLSKASASLTAVFPISNSLATRSTDLPSAIKT